MTLNDWVFFWAAIVGTYTLFSMARAYWQARH